MQGVLPNKRAQPSHLLKFRNRAYGYDTPGPRTGVARSAVDAIVKEKSKRKSDGKREISQVKKKRVKT